MSERLFLRFALRETMGVVFMGVALFWSAGQLNWWPAWALVIVTAAWAASTSLVIVHNNPELLAERLGPRKGAKRWDTIIMSIYGVLQLAMLVVAGLDQRFGWRGAFSSVAQVSAFVLVGLGQALVVWATAVNSYFSQIARLQTERGHHVIDSGPYQFVRHPGYFGSILIAIGSPILLSSTWALGLGLISALVMALRTYLEDQMLQRDLTGYQQYTDRVQQRLLPRIW